MPAATSHKKVWECQLFSAWRNVKSVDVMFPYADLNQHVEFWRRYVDGNEPEISAEEYPAYIFFSPQDLAKTKKDNLPDMFMGHGGLAIVSGAMQSLMQRYELGQTRFHEVPLYEYDQKTQRPGRWYLGTFLKTTGHLLRKKQPG